MNKKKDQIIPIITSKEKESPAYRKKLEEEIVNLKSSLQTTQNQASSLQEKNIELERDNLLLKERIRGAGIEHVLEVIYTLLVGAGIPYFIDKNYQAAATLLLLGVVIYFIQMLVRAFWKR